MSRFQEVQPVNCKININPFLLGVARLFDFAQVLNIPGRKSAAEVDRIAMHNDWVAIGFDLQKALDRFGFEFSNGQ